MKYENIADIYSANQKIREQFIATLGQITPDEAVALPDGEKWSIQQIVEHLSMVEFSTARICTKLLAAAKANERSSDGSFSLSENFGERANEIEGLKIEAPDVVQPTGNVTIAESLEKMDANREAFASMRYDLGSLDLSEAKFPHPFFGELTAGEWLVMAGLHERRHTKQIERLLENVRQ